MKLLTGSVVPIFVAILGLCFLMIVHETGHFLAARRFKMRVKVFSIGFGPALFKHQPKGSETVYQIAIIPFLAYVQVAGMNPLEEIDPNDKRSYANASLLGRISTIFAGPLANYLVASVLFFAALMYGGRTELTTMVEVMPGTPAAQAGIQDHDKIVEVAGETIKEWDRLRELISARPNQNVDVVVERGSERVSLKVVPKPDGEHGPGRIGVRPQAVTVPVPATTAVLLSLERPPQIVVGVVVSLAHIALGLEKFDPLGPVGITKEIAKAYKQSIADYLQLLGILSAYLAGFNLLPFPGLDGARLTSLGYELTTRKRINQQIEAKVHAFGVLILLALIAVVTVFSDFRRP